MRFRCPAAAVAAGGVDRYGYRGSDTYNLPMRDASGPHLSLWKQALGVVPESVWERKDLQTLVLADNGLTDLSDRIGDLRHLRMLDLGHNRLRRVPDSIGDLEGLTDFLYLHDND